MATNPKTTTTKIQAVSRAAGMVTSVTNQIVTVTFDNLQYNPEFLRGQVRSFKFDIGKARFSTGTWVVASWGTSVRTDSAGNYLIQGSVGGGVYVRPLEFAANNPKLAGWLSQVRQHIQDAENRRISTEQGKQKSLPSTNPLQILHSSTSGNIITGPSLSWQGVPVPLPIMKEEWELSDSYLRIGYVSFLLESPVEDIQVGEITPSESISTLRSRSPIQKHNWHSVQQVTISFTLHGQDAQNQILLPLVKMARKAPFVPVFNTLLFEYDITAITITDIQTTTIPGFPNSLKAVITGYSFNWKAYLPSAREFSGFDWQICYPLFKLWIEKPLNGAYNFHVPMGRRWDGRFVISHPSEDWLKATNEFGQLAEKATRTNDDIDSAVRAVNWRDGQITTSQTNFIPVPSFSDQNTSQITMSSNVARVQSFTIANPISFRLDQFTDATFIKVKTELAAYLLCDSPDTLAVYIGVPVLEANTPFNAFDLSSTSSPNPTNPSANVTTYQASPKTQSNEIPKESVKIRLGNSDPQMLALLQNGGLTFVVNSSSSIFDNIAFWHRTPVPKEPSANPVPDPSDIFAPPSMVIEQIACQFQNTIAQLQPRGERTPTHQFLGSNATVYNVVGTLKDQLDIGHMEQFFQTINRLARQYRGRLDGTPFGGFVFIDNEFFQFMGTKLCIITSFSTQTIPDFPGAVKFEMQMVEFDPTQRRREILDDLFADFTEYPINVSATQGGSVQDFRVLSQQDTFTTKYAKVKDFDNRLRKIEIYPDLSLPLHSELAKWVTDIQNGVIWDFDNNVAILKEYDFLNLENGGTGWDWTSITPILDTDGNTVADSLPDAFLRLAPPAERPDRFADPDFWVGTTQVPGDQFVDSVVSLSKNRSVTISDPYGAVAKIQAGTPITENSLVSDPGNSVKNAKASVAANSYPKPQGSNFGPVDGKDANSLTQGNTSTISNTPNSNAFAIPAATTTNRPAPIANVDDRPLPQRVAAYGPVAAIAAKKFSIPPDLLMAHIEAESTWKAKVVSRTGAIGLGQIEPKTGVGLGVPNPSDLYDPVTNIFTTARYISQLRKIFASHPDGERLAIAAYNAGPGAVKKAGFKIPPFPETQNYVSKVILNRSHYKVSGNSSPGLDLTGSDDSTTREARQLFGQFKQGFGYNLNDIFPYMILGSGIPANSSQAFDPSWFRRVVNTSTGDTFMVVKAAFLPNFIEAERKYQVFPKLVKIPEVLPGKNLYDHTANSEAADDNTVTQSFTKDNPITSFPRNLAAFSAGLGVRAAGGSVADQTTAEAEVIKKGISISDVGRGAQEVIGAGGAFVGTLAGGGSLNDASTAANNSIVEKEAAADAENGPSYTPPTVQQIFHDPVTKDAQGNIISGGHDIFHDLRQEVTTGRLISAFPTFYVAVIDGGRPLRVWRLFDHVYGMLSVTRIAVHRTRKSPVETAVVGFSNMYGHLTAQAVDTDRVKSSDTRGIWTSEALFRGITNTLVPEFNEETLAMWARHINSLVLKPGARLHIRLGYGSDASLLPIVFNGVISEVPVEEGEVEVIALSDGVELTNDIAPTDMQGSMPVTRLTSLFGEGLNPRELVTSFMAPNGLLDSAANAAGSSLGNFFYFLSSFRNAYGIEHFGSPYRLGIRFDDGEIGINIYDPEHSQPFTQTSSADSILRILQPHKWSTTSKLLGINMSNATPWEIFDTVRKTVPDYILYTHPFELRSTLFMGKSWFPIFTNYKQNIDPSLLLTNGTTNREQYFDWKPFQQLHIISSDWNLIGNKVIADATDVVTKVQAVGTYSGWKPWSTDMSIESSFLMMLDSDIYDEFQKMKVVESGLYTTFNMKVTEGPGASPPTFVPIPGLVGLITNTVGLAGSLGREFFLSRRIMDYYAAMALKDHVKDMYQGPLVVIGSPYYKPYDFIAIVDTLSGMNGLAEIKECVHTMSLDTGYVTTVTPDCVARYCLDTEGTDLISWVAISSSHLIAAASIGVYAGKLARRISPYYALRALRKYQKFLEDSIKDAENGQVLGQTKQVAVEALGKVRAAVQKVAQAAKTADSLKIRDALAELGQSSELKLFANKTPFWIKAELQVQQVLRAIPSSEIGQTVQGVVASIKSNLKSTIFDLNVKAGGAASAAADELEAAQSLLNGLGKNPGEIEQAKKALKAGGKAAAAAAVDGDLATGIKLVQSAEQKLSLAEIGAATLSKIPEIEATLRSVASEATHANTIAIVLTQAVSILIGGFSDYVIRSTIARQCLTLYPLRIYRKELTAGINGHRGAVAGDDIDLLKGFTQNVLDFFRTSWVGNFVPVINDLLNEGVTYRHPDTTPSFLRQ